MEVQIRKKHVKTKSETSGGAWFTAERLKTEKQWSKMLALIGYSQKLYLIIAYFVCNTTGDSLYFCDSNHQLLDSHTN